MSTPLLVRCGMILPFLPPLADLPPGECLFPPPIVHPLADVESSTSLPEVAAQTREMIQLRRSLQMSPLSGSILDSGSARAAVGTGASSSDEAEFAQVLHRVVESTPVRPVPIASADPSATDLATGSPWKEQDRCAPTRAIFEQNSVPEAAVPLSQQTSNPADIPGFLRNIGRELDDLANDCEEQQEYQTADRLRELSDHLRRRARAVTR